MATKHGSSTTMTHSTAGGVADSALASEESDDPSIRGLRGIISESTPRYASAATTQLSTVFAHPTLAATPAVVIGAGIGSARLSPESISSAGSELSSSQSSGSSMASLRALNTSAQHRARVAGMAERLLAAPAAANRFCLDKQDVRLLCQLGRSVFMSQPVLLELGTPVKVVGDIHGQFGDLLRILHLCGRPPATNYLFLGDYVDRGKQSLETFLLLLCFKILYPTHLFMLRGNHECASVTKVYGFYDECKRRLDVKAWRSLVDVFNVMPIAATIGGRIFCVHGGLSPYLNSLDDIRGIARPTDVPGSGLLSDLLWSDPERGIVDWAVNDRGVSYCFGPQVLAKFCQKFNFDLVARGHMVVEEGYEFFGSRKLVTIFSAPNYCGEFSNWGAVMSVSKDLLCSFELLKPAPAKKARKKRWY